MKIGVALRNGIKLFRETLSLNLASVITVITVLFIYNVFVVIGSSSDAFLKEMTRVDSIRVYIKASNRNSVETLIQKVQELEGVDTIEYFSSQDAYNHLKESTVNINYLDKIPQELFPSFLEVKIKKDFQEVSYLRELERKIITFENVDIASYGEKWIKNFGDIRSAVRIFMILLTLLLTVSVGIIVFNTIRLSLFRYKEDIRIYNLVGATRTFIETPYVISSLIEISIAFILSSSLVYAFMLFLNLKLLAPVGLNFIILPPPFYYLKTYLFLVFISVVSSMVCVASFLNKVKSINES
jgi:cell division transport system permease protein